MTLINGDGSPDFRFNTTVPFDQDSQIGMSELESDLIEVISQHLGYAVLQADQPINYEIETDETIESADDATPTTTLATVTDIAAYRKGRQRRQEEMDSEIEGEQMTLEELQALEVDDNGQVALEKDRHQLVMRHQYIARNFGRKYHAKSMSHLDLTQEGSVGLILAAKKFEPEKGVLFSTFARRYVKGTILKAIRDKDLMLSNGPREDDARRKGVAEAALALASAKKDATKESLARQSGLSVEDIVKQEERSTYVGSSTSLDAVLDEVRPSLLFADRTANTEALALKIFDSTLLAELLKHSGDDRLYDILCYRKGLPPYDEPHTQEQTATFIGCSQYHISRLENKAYGYLKEQLIKRELTSEDS